MNGDLLLAEVFRRSDQLLATWAVHTGVAVAVLALVLAVPAVRDDRRARRVFAAGFVFLALANLEGMFWVLKQWRAVADALRDSVVWAAGRPTLADVVDAPHPLWVLPFHLILDVFVIWVVLRSGRPPAR